MRRYLLAAFAAGMPDLAGPENTLTALAVVVGTVAMVVVLLPASEAEPTLQPAAVSTLARLGVHSIDLRDALASRIYSGTSDIQRNLAARHMGL
mgnify:CR=1 FL=1